jgi:hypothetical protein
VVIAYSTGTGAKGTGSGESGGSITINSGDFVIAHVALRSTSVTVNSITLKAGSTMSKLEGPIDQSTNVRSYLYYFKASSNLGSNAPTLALSGSARHAWTLAVYTGVASTAPYWNGTPTSATGSAASVADATVDVASPGMRMCISGTAAVKSANATSTITIAAGNGETERQEQDQVGSSTTRAVSSQLQEYDATGASPRTMSADCTCSSSTIQWVIQSVTLLAEHYTLEFTFGSEKLQNLTKSFTFGTDSNYGTNRTVALAPATYTVTFPSTYTTGGVTYTFRVWEDASTNPARSVVLSADTTITAYYVVVGSQTFTFGTQPAKNVTVPFTFGTQPALVGVAKTFTFGTQPLKNSTVPFTFGSQPQALGLTKTFSFGSQPQAIGLTKTFPFGTQPLKNSTVPFTFNTNPQATGLTKTFSFGSQPQALGLTQTFSFGSDAQAVGLTKSFTFNTEAQAINLLKTFTFATEPQAVSVTKAFTFNTEPKAVGLTEPFTFGSEPQSGLTTYTIAFTFGSEPKITLVPPTSTGGSGRGYHRSKPIKQRLNPEFVELLKQYLQLKLEA